MSALETQVANNTAALEAFSTDAKLPSQLNKLSSALANLDKFILEQSSSGEVLHIDWVDFLASIDTSVKNINYASIRVPQLFNPDAAAVTANTDAYTLVASDDIAFVTHNGQVLDDSEYSLALNVLTVTPDNTFIDTADEVLVFQHSFTSYSTGNQKAYTAVTATYTILDSDEIIDCTSGTFTLSLSSTVAGKPYIIKNSGSGLITLNMTIDGVSGRTLSQNESLSIFSNGTNYIIT